MGSTINTRMVQVASLVFWKDCSVSLVNVSQSSVPWSTYEAGLESIPLVPSSAKIVLVPLSYITLSITLYDKGVTINSLQKM